MSCTGSEIRILGLKIRVFGFIWLGFSFFFWAKSWIMEAHRSSDPTHESPDCSDPDRFRSTPRSDSFSSQKISKDRRSRSPILTTLAVGVMYCESVITSQP